MRRKTALTKNKHQANFVEETNRERRQHDRDQHFVYATQDCSDENGENWYLDSGCSNHMIKDKSIFKDVNDSIKESVTEERYYCKIEDKGAIMVKTQKRLLDL